MKYIELCRIKLMENNSTEKNDNIPPGTGIIKGFLRVAGISFVSFLLWSIILVCVYRFVNPVLTPLMIIRVFEQALSGKIPLMKRQWVDYDEVSSHVPRALIAAEDNLFVRHNGFDMVAIRRALINNRKGKRLRGGSTISQQTAKNVFLWPGRSYLRKGVEAYYTVLIERIWGKRRILEVYLNVIETAEGVYGVQASSRRFFKKHASTLSREQAALIAAVLPSPRRFSIKKPSVYVRARQSMILRVMRIVETPARPKGMHSEKRRKKTKTR